MSASGYAETNDAVAAPQADARSPNRRTFLLAAIGTVCGLAVAGFGLFTASGTTTLFVPAEDVALVNQQPLSRIDYRAALASIEITDATPEQRRAALDAMIREELFVQRARELDVASVDPEVRAAMVRSVEEQAAASAVLERPTEEKLRAFYEAHRDAYASEGKMTVKDFVFADAAAASAAVARAGAGEGVPGLIAAGGRDSGRVDGEEFYFATKIHLGERLFGAAAMLTSGAMSPPIEDDGVHVLAMIRNRPPVKLSFEASRARVLDDYRRDAIARRQAREADFLRKRATILIAPDLR